MKKTLRVVLIAFISLIVAVSCDTKKESGGYKVGDKGPSGGLVVYVNPNAETDGWTYLEAAPSDAVIGEETTFMFGLYYEDGEGSGSPDSYFTEDGIGKGESNTRKLLETASKRYIDSSSRTKVSNFAPKVASEYTATGVTSGWFLPSYSELEKMWAFKTELGMNAETYLSSYESEYSIYVVSTNDSLYKVGDDKTISTSDKAAVRAVRTF